MTVPFTIKEVDDKFTALDLTNTTNGSNISTLQSDVSVLQAFPSANGLNAGRVAMATYNFATLGGAIGTIGLGVTLPDNAIIRRAWYEVLTTCTSANDTATIALSIPTDGVLVDAVAIADGSNPFDAGLHDIVNAANICENIDSPTTYLKLTAARQVSIVVAVQNLTAGKINFYLDYVAGL